MRTRNPLIAFPHSYKEGDVQYYLLILERTTVYKVAVYVGDVLLKLSCNVANELHLI